MLDILVHNHFKLVARLLALLACVHQRGRMGPAKGPILLLLLSELIYESVALYLAYVYRNNIWFYNLTIPLEVFILLLIAWRNWQNVIFHRFLLGAGSLFAVVYSIEMMANRKVLAERAYLTECILMAGTYTALLFHMAWREDTSPVRIPLFWFFFSCIVFFGGMVPLMGLFNVMNEHKPQLFIKIYHINDVLTHLRFALIIVPFFLIAPKKPVSDIKL